MIERYNPTSRYRQRNRQRTLAMVIFCVTLGFAVVIGYWFGGQSSRAQIISQEKQIAAMEQDLEKSRNNLTAALTKEQEARMRLDLLNVEVESIAPSDGPLRELIDLLRVRLNSGTSADRLALAIRASKPPSNCTDPTTKRVVVTTPAYKGKDSDVNIDNSAVIIKASGSSAIGSNGEPEAWYDQGKLVEISLTSKDGAVINKKSILPITTSMVVDKREYRFTLSTGAKSFMKVTYDSCDYP